MLNRWVENAGLLPVLEEEGIGCIAFSPLAQGMLTDKYLKAVPDGSRATAGKTLRPEFISDANLEKVRRLNDIAKARGQSLAQMAIAWVLRDARVTSALIGASRVEQVEDCVAALARRDFSSDELAQIDRFATESGINLWAASSAHG
jgi:L-glyceraldehyde 3-phosphate reductase